MRVPSLDPVYKAMLDSIVSANRARLLSTSIMVMDLRAVYPLPRVIAVLVDDKCASSYEDFVLMARQSGKVTVVSGTRTAGVHDYGNVRSLWLPGRRRLRLPTSRSRQLPAGAIDNVGLAPDAWIPLGAPDTIRFAAITVAARALH
ncbi:MAG: S41 family peptidase [Gemmatimonadota bacterium]|nr:S41 family peptidase [Gemmatimonadota bacterium]